MPQQPKCAADEQIMPQRRAFYKPVLEEFYNNKFAQALENLRKEGSSLRVVIATTWHKVCGLAYYSRYLIKNIEQIYAKGAVLIDIAEIVDPKQSRDDTYWPPNNVIGSADHSSIPQLEQLG